jgi:hypothetical protein
VYDLPEAMVMLQSSHLENWGMSFYEVFEHGLSNLAEIDASFTTVDEQTYVSSTQDHYDASRLLLPELIRELPVAGDPVVMLPSRDRLLVTGSEDRRGLETVALLAQQLLAHPRPVSGLAFTLNQDEWNCWLPDTDHPAYAIFKTLALQSTQVDYQQQRPLLQRLLATSEPDTDVAEFRLHGAGAKQPPTSFCVWREGRRQLLPRTDRICLLRHDQSLDHPLVEGINVAWGRAERLLDDFLGEQEAIYPPRYQVDRFPSSALLARLN